MNAGQPLPVELRERAAKLRSGTNDQHTPGLLDKAADEIERLSAYAVDIRR